MSDISAHQPKSTLDAVDEALEANQERLSRRYLGMSGIGHPCARKLWYDFRWWSPKAFPASVLKKFEDGHLGEELMAKRLRLVEGIELVTHQEDGKQIGFADLEGHFRGHMDGLIKGLLEAPKTQHVWEHKQTAEKKHKDLAKLKAVDEKSALQKWDETYYAQAVLYMWYSWTTRHFLTCATPGGREYISVRTDENKPYAAELVAKAEAIINAKTPPRRLSDDPSYYQCKWCDHYFACHFDQEPVKGCRTCQHSSPARDGKWECDKFGEIPEDFEAKGCDEWSVIKMV